MEFIDHWWCSSISWWRLCILIIDLLYLWLWFFLSITLFYLASNRCSWWFSKRGYLLSKLKYLPWVCPILVLEKFGNVFPDSIDTQSEVLLTEIYHGQDVAVPFAVRYEILKLDLIGSAFKLFLGEIFRNFSKPEREVIMRIQMADVRSLNILEEVFLVSFIWLLFLHQEEDILELSDNCLCSLLLGALVLFDKIINSFFISNFFTSANNFISTEYLTLLSH